MSNYVTSAKRAFMWAAKTEAILSVSFSPSVRLKCLAFSLLAVPDDQTETACYFVSPLIFDVTPPCVRGIAQTEC